MNQSPFWDRASKLRNEAAKITKLLKPLNKKNRGLATAFPRPFGFRALSAPVLFDLTTPYAARSLVLHSACSRVNGHAGHKLIVYEIVKAFRAVADELCGILAEGCGQKLRRGGDDIAQTAFDLEPCKRLF